MKTLTTTAERRFAWMLLTLLAVGFVIATAPRAAAPFGDSDEGLNAAQWAVCSRSLRERGPIDSAMGGRRLDGTRYATHPPMLCWTSAASEAVFGEHEWATRLPVVLASLAAIPLLYLVLAAVGTRPAVAAGATGFALATPMFFTYGPMLDTPVLAFPFGLLVLLAWQRAWRPPFLVLAGLLAGLAGWQAALLTVLLGAALVATARRTTGLMLLGGAALGLVISFGWSAWVYGSLSRMGEKLAERSGEASTFGESISFQVSWLAVLLSLSAALLPVAVVALGRDRFRQIAAPALATVGLYGVVFHAGAGSHQFWNYWALLPCAVGAAWLLDRVDRDTSTTAPCQKATLLVASVAIVSAVNLLPGNKALDSINDGHAAAELLRTTSFPPGQQDLWYVSQLDRPYTLVVYYTDLTPRHAGSMADLAALARTRPGDLVFVVGSCAGEQFCRRAVEVLGSRRMLPAADVMRTINGP